MNVDIKIENENDFAECAAAMLRYSTRKLGNEQVDVYDKVLFEAIEIIQQNALSPESIDSFGSTPVSDTAQTLLMLGLMRLRRTYEPLPNEAGLERLLDAVEAHLPEEPSPAFGTQLHGPQAADKYGRKYKEI